MNNRKKANKHERNVAKRFHGKQTIGSGAIWFSKGDVETDKLLIECKISTNGYYQLKSETWEKIENEAIKENKIPIMSIEINEVKYILFAPKYFSETWDLVDMVELTRDNYVRSFRITNNIFETSIFGEVKNCYKFALQNTRHHQVCLMGEEKFKEILKGEI